MTDHQFRSRITKSEAAVAGLAVAIPLGTRATVVLVCGRPSGFAVFGLLVSLILVATVAALPAWIAVYLHARLRFTGAGAPLMTAARVAIAVPLVITASAHVYDAIVGCTGGSEAKPVLSLVALGFAALSVPLTVGLVWMIRRVFAARRTDVAA